MNSTELPAQKTASERLREQAIALRRAGHSRREIKALLGITSNATLDRALRGEPPPEWTRRPNAKDEVRARARELRSQGLDYEEIVAALGVSKSSVSLWVRDMPRPPRLSYEETRKRAAEGVRRYWAAERPAREARREAVRAAAAADIGVLSSREILIAGSVAYWCEGAKSKPYRSAGECRLHQQRPRLDQVLPAVPKRGRSRVNTARVPRAHPRERGHSCGGAVLAAVSPVPSRPSFTGRRSSGTTREPSARTSVPTTTGASSSVFGKAPSLYRRIEGWVRAVTGGEAKTVRTTGGVRSRTRVGLPGKDSNLR